MEKDDLTDNNFSKNQIGRRSFLKNVTASLGGITLMNWGLFPFKDAVASILGGNTGNNQEKLIFIAIDALHPKYFELDAKGSAGRQRRKLADAQYSRLPEKVVMVQKRQILSACGHGYESSERTCGNIFRAERYHQRVGPTHRMG